MKQISKKIMAIVVLSGLIWAMPPAQMKQILNMTKSSWVSFRDFNGKQLIYFTHLESYTCGIKEVKYSIDSDKLDKIWTLQPCDTKNPMAVTKPKPYLSLKLNSAKSIALKITFVDDSKSEIVYKKP